MIRVTVDGGKTHDVPADASRVMADGSLHLFRWGSVGPYQCPLLKEKVAEFSSGGWKTYTFIKDDE